MPRDFCYRCRLAKSTCFCDRIRPVEARTRFLLLQHPREVRKRIGTARMAHLCLPNSLLIEGIDFSEHPVVRRELADRSYHPAILFPGGVEVGATEEWLPAGKIPLVLVIDGTWPNAETMVRLNPALTALTRVSFVPRAPSEYGRIRRQPRPECLSTIEAVHEVLHRIEPGVDAGALLDVFRWRVDRQAAYAVTEEYRS